MLSVRRSKSSSQRRKFLFISTGMGFTVLHCLATGEIAVTARMGGACCCTLVCIYVLYIYTYIYIYTHTQVSAPARGISTASEQHRAKAEHIWFLPAEVSGILVAKIAPCVQSSVHTQPCTAKRRPAEGRLRQTFTPNVGKFRTDFSV